MVDTSSGQLAFVKETVAGAAPATPAFQVLDFTSEDFAMTTAQVRSTAVTAQRVVKANRRAGKEVGGGFTFELYKAAEVDAILASLLGNPFAGTPSTSKAGGLIVDTYTFERKLSATDYRRFHGVRLGSAAFTVAPEANITCAVTAMGFTETTAAAPITGATYAAVGTADKLNALDVTAIALSNGLTGSFDYDQLAFTVNNQLAVRKRLGPQSVRSIGAGQALVTGSMGVYVPDKSMADAFIADQRFDMDVPMILAGAGYTAHFENVVITSYTDANTGNGDEFMGRIEFESTLDLAYGSSFGFQKTGV